MLKPITKDEKLAFTLKLQMERALDDILATLLYDEKYLGHVDIWPIMQIKHEQVEMIVEYKKVATIGSPMSHPDAVRYYLNPEKGVKLANRS